MSTVSEGLADSVRVDCTRVYAECHHLLHQRGQAAVLFDATNTHADACLVILELDSNPTLQPSNQVRTD